MYLSINFDFINGIGKAVSQVTDFISDSYESVSSCFNNLISNNPFIQYMPGLASTITTILVITFAIGIIKIK